MNRKNFRISRVIKTLRNIFILLLTLLIMAGLCWHMLSIFFYRQVVDGHSMEPTLHDRDVLAVKKYYSIDCGDIVIINSSQLGCIVKRVIATEGQTVDIDFDRGTVSVDGTELNEQLYTEGEKLQKDHFINTLTTKNLGAFESYPVTVPEGHVFVLGDNRDHSWDSRHPKLGFVPVADIDGEVAVTFTSLSDFRLC